MALPLFPLITGAAVGILATYLMKNKKSNESKEKTPVENISTTKTSTESEKPASDLN